MFCVGDDVVAKTNHKTICSCNGIFGRHIGFERIKTAGKEIRKIRFVYGGMIGYDQIKMNIRVNCRSCFYGGSGEMIKFTTVANIEIPNIQLCNMLSDNCR